MQSQTTFMLRTSRLVQNMPFFYGWVVLAAGTLGIIMTSPGQTYAVSIFTEHFITDLDLSRSMVSTRYSAGTLLGSLALLLPATEQKAALGLTSWGRLVEMDLAALAAGGKEAAVLLSEGETLLTCWPI